MVTVTITTWSDRGTRWQVTAGGLRAARGVFGTRYGARAMGATEQFAEALDEGDYKQARVDTPRVFATISDRMTIVANTIGVSSCPLYCSSR